MHQLATNANNKIIKLWDDPKVDQTGLACFSKKLKAKGISVTRDDLKSILQHQRAHDLHVTRSGRNRLQ